LKIKKTNQINRRYLKHKIESINYNKITIKLFNKYKHRMLAYYFYKEYGLFSFIKVLKHYSDRNFFKSLDMFPDVKIEIEKTFDTKISDKIDRLRIFKFQLKKLKCKECHQELIGDKTFCSVKCLNVHKSKDPKFKKKLSEATKLTHKNRNKSKKLEINKKIQNSINKLYSNLTKEQKRNMLKNKVIRFTAYENFISKYKNLVLLCSKDFFYKNKYIPVKCCNCNNNFIITKTTSYSNTECRVCNPSSKHKLQNEITAFIREYYKDFIIEDSRKYIYPKEIDIVIPELKLGIEFDGLLYHSSGISSTFKNTPKDYHLNKTELVEEQGFQLFHIFENEWIDETKQNIWKSVIKNKINPSVKIFARKCIVKIVNSKDAKKFLHNNHLQGSCSSKINLGLYYNNELVSIMTFGKARFNKNIEYELIRFCSKINTSVTGGASKLLKYFERNYNPKSIISYANRRWSFGNLYEKLNFEFKYNTQPNYFYFKINQNILYTRNKFQKHKLDKLEFFDKNLTETQNMYNNNYRKIYDCGNKVYIKEY